MTSHAPSADARAGGPGERQEARWFLREHTSELHEAAERALGEEPMERLDSYVGMLQANLAMTEAVLAAARPYLPEDMIRNLEQDRGRLRCDLAFLGSGPGLGPGAASAPFALRDRAEAMGALYVCEGARLGGRVLARQVSERLGLGAENGAGYLSGGADQSARWRDFQGALERELVTTPARKAALEAACRVFELIIRSYEGPGCDTR